MATRPLSVSPQRLRNAGVDFDGPEWLISWGPVGKVTLAGPALPGGSVQNISQVTVAGPFRFPSGGLDLKPWFLLGEMGSQASRLQTTDWEEADPWCLTDFGSHAVTMHLRDGTTSI